MKGVFVQLFGKLCSFSYQTKLYFYKFTACKYIRDFFFKSKLSVLTSRQSHTQVPVTESQKVELYGMRFVSLHTMLQIVEFIVQFI